MIYFAYGSNLCKAQMKDRCPDARPLGKFFLRSARLVFRGAADCIHAKDETCPGALWRITSRCERALDAYEGISGGHYRKEFVRLNGVKGEDRLMFYVTDSEGVFPPAERYLSIIRRGYKDFGLPLDYLETALQFSWDEKHPSHIERKRYMRHGRPRLAQPLKSSTKVGTGSLATGNQAGLSQESA